MNHKSKPESRLTIVFILAMVLSGGILTYFSINNISNLKKLSEKRILEEEQKLAARFTTSLQHKLEKLSAGLESGTYQGTNFLDIIISPKRDHEYVVQAFLIRDREAFIFPNFTGIYNESLKPELTAAFTTAYEQGESAEFAENDPAKAAEYYKSCLELSARAADSAAALNALGRVSIKSGEIEQATNYYIVVVRDYPTISDKNGFPYAYYAIHNLVNHTREENRDRILTAVENCLSGMVRGSIPLNYQSGELFDLVYRWVNEIKFDDTARLLKIESNIHNLNGQLQFVEQNGDELKAIIQEGDLRIQHQDQNSIRVVASTISEEPQFYLFKSTPKYAAGFLVDQDSFLITLVNTLEQENLEFNYIHYFSNENNLSSTSNNLIYSIHLNPYFPELTLQIYPQDEDLISDLVKRRSWIYGVATFLLLAAMLLGIVLTQRDLAREKNLASLRSDFISNVTHELKTPLTSIRMYAESMMMRRLKSGPDQQKYLSVIVNESERLKRMINNILEFSKMEKDRQEYHPVEANLSDILNSAILDMTYWLEKNRFTLKQEIQPDVKALFDPDKLYQVFTNLLSNAIKYSDDSKNIYVRLYQNHDAVITEVKDEGIGISEKEQSKIFEEFYRVENHESGNIAGTGLGLTVVKEIVEAHHGQIKVESEVGKGSKFSVILFKQSIHENRSDHRG